MTPVGKALTEMLDQYFETLGDARPTGLHKLVIGAVERPLLEYVMRRCGGNQRTAAQALGINRNTLHKKLAEYGLLGQDKPNGESK